LRHAGAGTPYATDRGILGENEFVQVSLQDYCSLTGAVAVDPLLSISSKLEAQRDQHPTGSPRIRRWYSSEALWAPLRL